MEKVCSVGKVYSMVMEFVVLKQKNVGLKDCLSRVVQE